jgi:hypothetical protein
VAQDIKDAVEDLTDRVTALRVVTSMQRNGRLSLTGKLAALTESAQDFNKGTEEVLDSIAAKIELAKTKRDAAAEKHHGYYDTIIKGVDESVVVIDRLSNVPLSGDGGS